VLELGGPIGQMMAVGAVLIRIETKADEAPAAATVAAAAAPAPHRRTGVAYPAPTPSVPEPARPGPPRRARAPWPHPPCANVRSHWASTSPPCAAAGPRAVCCTPTWTRMMAATPRAAAGSEGTREIRVIGLRRAIAHKMQESKRRIPHYTYVEEVDVTEVVALRDELNRQHAATRGELSPLTLVVRAVVQAVADFPQVNGRFDDEAGV
jgi:2-oxoisovalerate dehydrogenase E2 component (dihydrolipoyl transacylase)